MMVLIESGLWMQPRHLRHALPLGFMVKTAGIKTNCQRFVFLGHPVSSGKVFDRIAQIGFGIKQLPPGAGS